MKELPLGVLEGAHRILDSQRDGRNVCYRVVNPHARTVLGCIRRHVCDT